jgi:phosphate transport system ATP-binding protein
MHDLYPHNRYEGAINFHPDNTNLLSPEVDPIEVRMRISMVFQKPNPFPKSIYENVAYGLRVRGERKSRSVIDDKVEERAAWRGVVERGQAIASRNWAPTCQAGSNSGCASPAPWRPIRS